MGRDFGQTQGWTLAKQGTKQKQREELCQEGRRAAHEGLCPVGEQRLHCERGGEESSALQPRSASQTSSANPSRIPMRPMVSDASPR
jgi:hypothetical protein